MANGGVLGQSVSGGLTYYEITGTWNESGMDGSAVYQHFTLQNPPDVQGNKIRSVWGSISLSSASGTYFMSGLGTGIMAATNQQSNRFQAHFFYLKGFGTFANYLIATFYVGSDGVGHINWEYDGSNVNDNLPNNAGVATSGTTTLIIGVAP